MIERSVVAGKIKEYQIEEYVLDNLKRVGHSKTTLQRTPLGEKVVIHASRPGLVVGRQGESIKKLTASLKERFKLDNPQVEVAEVTNIYLDANIVAEMIASTLERFGPNRFKATMYRSLDNVIRAGAMGAEIVLSGKLPGKRARTWRVYQGHLKKSGDIAQEGVQTAITSVMLKSGVVGVKVRLMPPDLKLPDHVEFVSELQKEEGPADGAVSEIEEIQDATATAQASADETKEAKKTDEKAEKKAEGAPKAPAKKEAAKEKKAPAKKSSSSKKSATASAGDDTKAVTKDAKAADTKEKKDGGDAA